MSNTSANPPFFDVRLRGFAKRTDVDDVVALIRSRVSANGHETIALDDAAGRVLASNVIASVPVPHFDRAAFDGYALRSRDTRGPGVANPILLRIIADARPGQPAKCGVLKGDPVKMRTASPFWTAHSAG